ncbi:MAG: hypothetical protein AB1640_10240 [bacterium]
MKSTAVLIALLSTVVVLSALTGGSLNAWRGNECTQFLSQDQDPQQEALSREVVEQLISGTAKGGLGPRGILAKRHQAKKRTMIVRATAYNAEAKQTDSDPTVCAWGDEIRPGTIAVSRDLEAMGLTRGKEVFVEGFGKLTVLDRMHISKHNWIDIYMEEYKDAVNFGKQRLTIRWHVRPKQERLDHGGVRMTASAEPVASPAQRSPGNVARGG